jgi:phosphoglycerate kinase
MSLRPVAAKLAELLGGRWRSWTIAWGKGRNTAAALKDGDMLLLENVRYYKEEEANDPAFAGKLAALARFTSMTPSGLRIAPMPRPKAWPGSSAARGGVCAAGLLMQKELKFLGDELEQPARPFVVILGGAKVSDKIKVIDRLLDRADALLVGGAMTYTFALAQGKKVGKSLVEPDATGCGQGGARQGPGPRRAVSCSRSTTWWRVRRRPTSSTRKASR